MLSATKPRAELSDGTATPMPIHILKRPAPGALPDTALCGKPWDRLVKSGPLCDPCKAEYRRLHPTWPFPGGAA